MLQICTETRKLHITIKRKSASSYLQYINKSHNILQGSGKPSQKTKLPHKMKRWKHLVPSHSSQQKQWTLPGRYWDHIWLHSLKEIQSEISNSTILDVQYNFSLFYFFCFQPQTLFLLKIIYHFHLERSKLQHLILQFLFHFYPNKWLLSNTGTWPLWLTNPAALHACLPKQLMVADDSEWIFYTHVHSLLRNCNVSFGVQ